MKQRGYSIVELITVIIILGILVSLVTISVVRSQLIARDKERLDDVNAIAGLFEDIAKNGQTDGKLISGLTASVPMTYPSTAINSGSTQAQDVLGRLDRRALSAPKGTAGSSLRELTNLSQLEAQKPTPTDDKYLYVPINDDGTLCTDADLGTGTNNVVAPRLVNSSTCSSFTIYYYSEVDATVKYITSEKKNSDELF
jgi:prepilin-type N-terminal cleavage/methylation domain-containing protein